MSITKENKNDFDYAMEESVALARFKIWQTVDPFPDIKPALLNSADIADYANITSMVWPFKPDQLKSAAYEMLLGNEVLYWDDKGKEIHSTLANDTITFDLKRNSITYVTLKETFLLPDYIAVRFNLTINHVHKGLLLGTGPLVNPGFQGKIMVPIHNLTPNDYPLRPGEPLISVEFTKLSPRAEWAVDKVDLFRPTPRGEYIQKHKKGPTFKGYLDIALPHGVTKVESSLSHELDAAYNKISKIDTDAREQLSVIEERSRAEVEKSERSRIIVTVATLAGVAALAWMTWQIFQSYQTSANEKLYNVYSAIERQKNKIELVEFDLKGLRFAVDKKKLTDPEILRKLSELENQLKQAKEELVQIETKTYSIK